MKIGVSSITPNEILTSLMLIPLMPSTSILQTYRSQEIVMI